jgi:hypothetical protein
MSDSQSGGNLWLAVGAGVTAAIVGAAVWAIITITTKFQIGWMAIGVGALVGFAISYAGGSGIAFRILGALLALLGCMLGNFLSIVAFASDSQHISLFEGLARVDYAAVGSTMWDSLWSTDILFYAIAVYEGFRFSAGRARKEVAIENSPAR